MKNDPSVPAPVPLHEDRLFRGLVMAASAAGMGGVVSSLTLLQKGPSGFAFEWTNLAIPAFLLGAAISTGYWWAVFRSTGRTPGANPRRLLLIASAAMLAFALIAFLYPIRFIPQQKRADVIIGLSVAVFVLGTIGILIHTIVRWLDQDSEQNPDEP